VANNLTGTRLREPQPNVQIGQLSPFKKMKTAKQRTDDVYQRYAGCDPETESVADDALGYWNTRILTQPDLARFALDWKEWVPWFGDAGGLDFSFQSCC
jgi:hypothetical protein